MDLRNVRLEDYNMKNNFKYYPLFAEVFRYPNEGYSEYVKQIQLFLDNNYPEAANEFNNFATYMLNKTTFEQQELYTKTFDVQPICYLDLGYVIFGEDYKRGAFLLHMQQEQQAVNNPCGSELSDNICNILNLYAKHQNQQLLNELAFQIMIPGLKKMISEFGEARVDLKLKVLKKLHKAIIQEELNQGNVFKNALQALLIVFETDFKDVELNRFKELADVYDYDHHMAFFKKNSINNREVNQLINNYNID